MQVLDITVLVDLCDLEVVNFLYHLLELCHD